MLQKWIEKSYDKHISLNAQNEIIQILVLKVLRGIASGIAESGNYCIMADESTDVSNIEQPVICICWVDNEKSVCKEYIGLMPVAQISADIIVVCIKDDLQHMNCRIQDACGQCHDGCSTMQESKMRLLQKSRD